MAFLCIGLGLIVLVTVFEFGNTSMLLRLVLLFATFFFIGSFLNRLPNIKLVRKPKIVDRSLSAEQSNKTNLEFDIIPVAVMRLSRKGIILKANKAAQ